MDYIRVYEAISTHTTATVVGFFSFKIVDNVPCINPRFNGVYTVLYRR